MRRGLIPRNPCAYVPAPPLERGEIEYLRLAEIQPYIDGCGAHYRALAEFLIGTGTRVSEAVATRWPDLDLEQGVVRIYRQRSRTAEGTTVTKDKRFRSIQIGPRLAHTLRGVHTTRLSRGIDDGGWLFLCPRPRRGRYAARLEPLPPHRRTVHEWHEAALVDAGIRDMPLHSLRHTAAAAWLAVGHPLIFVQRQLGHRCERRLVRRGELAIGPSGRHDHRSRVAAAAHQRGRQRDTALACAPDRCRTHTDAHGAPPSPHRAPIGKSSAGAARR